MTSKNVNWHLQLILWTHRNQYTGFCLYNQYRIKFEKYFSKHTAIISYLTFLRNIYFSASSITFSCARSPRHAQWWIPLTTGMTYPGLAHVEVGGDLSDCFGRQPWPINYREDVFLAFLFLWLWEISPFPCSSVGSLPLSLSLHSLSRSFYSRCTFSIPKSIFCLYNSRLLQGWRARYHGDLQLLCNPSISPSHTLSTSVSSCHFSLFPTLLCPRGHCYAFIFFLSYFVCICSSLHFFLYGSVHKLKTI